jgi:hypothetical protein
VDGDGLMLLVRAGKPDKSGKPTASRFWLMRYSYGGKRREAGWKNARHRQLWRNTLTTDAFPHMGDLPIAEVATAHVMAALAPIWWEKTETASRVRGRLPGNSAGWRRGV